MNTETKPKDTETLAKVYDIKTGKEIKPVEIKPVMKQFTINDCPF